MSAGHHQTLMHSPTAPDTLSASARTISSNSQVARKWPAVVEILMPSLGITRSNAVCLVLPALPLATLRPR